MATEEICLWIGGESGDRLVSLGEILITLVDWQIRPDDSGDVVLCVCGNMLSYDTGFLGARLADTREINPRQVQFRIQDIESTQQYTTFDGRIYDIKFINWVFGGPGFRADFEVSWPEQPVAGASAYMPRGLEPKKGRSLNQVRPGGR